jgi:ribosome assembly protein RRB1
MLHRAKVEWPCLSLDLLLPDRLASKSYGTWFPHYVHSLDPKHTQPGRHGLPTHRTDRFPYTVYFCAGSQSTKKAENKIYVLKWSQMQKTLHDDEEVDSEEDEEQETLRDPVMRFEAIPHRGCVNRIRSMHGTGVVATWSDENEVGIYDVTSAYEALEQPPTNKAKKPLGGNKLAGFKHADEGYALDWSPLKLGRLAAGCCNSQIWLYTPADEGCSSFVKELQVGLQGHKKSVEDVQFSPS